MDGDDELGQLGVFFLSRAHPLGTPGVIAARADLERAAQNLTGYADYSRSLNSNTATGSSWLASTTSGSCVSSASRASGSGASSKTTWRSHEAKPAPALVERNFVANRPDELSVADIKYIRPHQASSTWTE
jgi:hypothetical protein